MGVSSKILINQAKLIGCFRPISCLKVLESEFDDDHMSFSCRKSSSIRNNIRVIKSDGGVKIYKRPDMKACEIMDEFPKHLVCRSDSFYIGQMIPTLSRHDRLQPGHTYFLFPTNFFQSVLSFASFIRCRSALTVIGTPPPLFEVEKTPTGSLRIKMSEQRQDDDDDNELVKDNNNKRVLVLCTTPQLRKDYEQIRRVRWKPKLDAIPEKNKYGGGRRIRRLPGRSRRIIRRTKC